MSVNSENLEQEAAELKKNIMFFRIE
jgi:hypothetical protein